MLSLPLHLHPIADAVRRLARKGWSTAAIARAHHITSIEVRWILRRGAPVHPVDPLRRIKGPLSRHVRTLAARGETPERIGELLRLEPGHVAAFLAGPPPRSPRPPREPRPKYIPREWGPSRGPEFKDDDDLVEVPELPRAAPSEPAIAAAEAAVLRPAPVPTATPVASGDWGPYQEVPGRRPVLTDAEAAEVQELAA